MDLSQLAAVVFDGTAYPLDGGAPYAVEVDPGLYPFLLPLMDRLSEENGFTLSPEALCRALGASWDWDEETQTATCTYRDVTVVLTAGSGTALVDGKAVALEDPPALRGDTLAVYPSVFRDAWNIDTWAVSDDEAESWLCWIILP